jgi:dihydrodipicolinate synthase/N-acetylneuraminate lyase
MLSKETLKGMWAGLPVPWTNDDQFDEMRFRRNVRRCCQVGVHGVYSHGTTGEFYAQSFEEWRAVALAMVEECRALGTPTQVGITDLSTGLVMRKAELAARMGAHAIQVALPFWLPMSVDEAVRFFRDVAAAVPGMPIVLYGTSRAKTLTTPDLLRRALDVNVPLIGCKYSGTMADLPTFVQACSEISFLVGEPHLATGMAAGGRGSCSAYIYVCPKYMLHYYSLCEQGNWAEAQQIERHVRAWLEDACGHLFAKGLQDSALDRVFAHAAGFIEIDLRCRPPYRSATQEDLKRYIQLCRERFPEFLDDIIPDAGAGIICE